MPRPTAVILKNPKTGKKVMVKIKQPAPPFTPRDRKKKPGGANKYVKGKKSLA